MENFAKISLIVMAFGICLNGVMAFPGFLLDLIDLELLSKNQIKEIPTYYDELTNFLNSLSITVLSTISLASVIPISSTNFGIKKGRI